MVYPKPPIHPGGRLICEKVTFETFGVGVVLGPFTYGGDEPFVVFSSWKEIVMTNRLMRQNLTMAAPI